MRRVSKGGRVKIDIHCLILILFVQYEITIYSLPIEMSAAAPQRLRARESAPYCPY